MNEINYCIFKNLENLRIWNNLVNQLVVLSHIIHIPAFIHQLSNEVIMMH
jgi:hypothetical protein